MREAPRLRLPTPDRGGLVFEPPKSKKGRRTLPLPKVIVTVLKEHRRLLREARFRAGPAWGKIAGTEDTGPDGAKIAGTEDTWVGPDGEAVQRRVASGSSVHNGRTRGCRGATATRVRWDWNMYSI